MPDLNRRPSRIRRRSTTELKSANPISTRAPQPLRRLLGHEIRRADCLSPTGYLTEDQDAGCSPEPRFPAPPHSLVRLVLRSATRCPSRLTMSVSRVAPPRGLSRACIPGRDRCVSRATSAHRLAAIPAGFPMRTRGPGLPGLTEPSNSAGRHGLRPFPAVTRGYRRQAAITATTEAVAVDLVEDRGVEPRTARLQGGCSPN